MYEWNTAQNEPLITLLLVLLKASSQSTTPILSTSRRGLFIHTPENNVLMHQCAISANDIKQKKLHEGEGVQAAVNDRNCAAGCSR